MSPPQEPPKFRLDLDPQQQKTLIKALDRYVGEMDEVLANETEASARSKGLDPELLELAVGMLDILLVERIRRAG